jgi:hypothetical protein
MSAGCGYAGIGGIVAGAFGSGTCDVSVSCGLLSESWLALGLMLRNGQPAHRFVRHCYSRSTSTSHITLQTTDAPVSPDMG